jgi:putative ABC transport system permease protein
VRTFISDLRWSLRLARQRPAFAATLVLTLAAAIAAVTSAFGVASAVLWRPLPFAHADRLAFVWENTGASGGTEPARVTGFRFTEWERGTRSLSSIAAFGSVGFLTDMGSGAVIVRGVRVTTNYFATLGIAPALGRDFTRADGQPGATDVVMLSHALWRQWLGGRPDAIGSRLQLGGRPYTIVGVMPPEVFPAWPQNPAVVTLDPDSRQLWVPMPRTAALAANTGAHVFGVVARLADGRSMEDASLELSHLTRAGDPDVHGAVLRPFRDQFVRDARVPLLALVGAALAVLLVACTNLAALQGSAMEARRAELSVRAALGAGRLRLTRQLATEAALFTLAGTAAGLALSRVLLSRLPDALPPSVPLLTTPSLGGAPSIAGAAVAVFAAVTLAAWPLARLRGTLSRGVVPVARTRVFRALVVAQVALAIALATSAALLQQSLTTVRTRDAGFVVDRVLVAGVTLSGAAYNASVDRVVDAERALTARLAALPGARGAAFAYDHPLEANWLQSFAISGSAAARNDAQSTAQLRIVSPSYFDTMGVAVVEGRGFSDRDDLAAPGAALVNEAFAQRLLDGPALNRTLRSDVARGSAGDPRLPGEFRIFGIVENERFKGLEAPSEPAVYLTTRQFPQRQLAMLVRAEREPLSLAAAARDTIRRFDPGVAVDAMTTLDAILAAQLVTRRATTHVIDGFAGAALSLAVLGLYGLLALLVAGRVRETGVRLALGSSPRVEALRVMRECVASTAIGVAFGLALAIAGARVVRTLLVGVTSGDPVTLAAVSLAMLLAALGAAAIPAWRAARVDPAAALRG